MHVIKLFKNRSTTQIWVLISMEFLRSFYRVHFLEEASDGVAKCRLGVLLEIVVGVVPPGSPNPDPISDQKM